VLLCTPASAASAWTDTSLPQTFPMQHDHASCGADLASLRPAKSAAPVRAASCGKGLRQFGLRCRPRCLISYQHLIYLANNMTIWLSSLKAGSGWTPEQNGVRRRITERIAHKVQYPVIPTP